MVAVLTSAVPNEDQRAPEAPRGSEERFRSLIENAQDLIAILDPSGTARYVSPSHYRVLGYQPEELVGRNAFDLVHPDDRAEVRNRFASSNSGGNVDLGEFRIRHQDGSWRVVAGIGKSLLDDPAVGGIVINSRDITEQRRAQEALRESEERFHDAFQHAAIGMALVALDGRWLKVNRSLCDLVGYSEEELLEGTFQDITHPGDLATDLDHVRQLLAGEVRTYQMEKRYFHKLGHAVSILLSVSLVRDSDGRPLHFVAQIQDITERKRAEQKTTTLLQIAKDISGTLDLHDLLERVQPRIAALLPCDRIITYYLDAGRGVYRPIAWHGIPTDRVSNTTGREFCAGQDVVDRLLAGQTVLINDTARQTPLAADVLAGITALLLVPLLVHGRIVGALAALNLESRRHFNAHQVRLFEGIAQQVGVAVGAADLYRAKQEEARASGALARVGHDLIAALDTPVLLDSLCRLTTEVLACDCSHTFLWQPHEDAYVPVSKHGDTAEQWESIRALKIPRRAVAGLLARLDREDMVQVQMAEPSDLLPWKLVAQHGITLSMFMGLRRGGEVFGIHAAGYRGRQEPFSSQQGRIGRGLAQIASLALENARLVEDLKRANSIKSEFVATMSHELRTPLNVIMGYNDLLLEGIFGPMTAAQTDTLQRMENSTRQLLELINQTLDLRRLEAGELPLEWHELQLSDLLDEIDAEIDGVRGGPEVTLQWEIEPELPRLQTDPMKLKAIVKNLVTNALKFTQHGRVTVRAHPSNDGVNIIVADTGIGIAPELLPLIFEPFRQGDGSVTRDYGGVGLGLYIVRRYLDLLGGTVSVESQPGRGSTFHVWVPARLSAAMPGAQLRGTRAPLHPQLNGPKARA